MALYGCNVPGAKKSEDQEARDLIFDIIAPYCLSAEDIEAIDEYPVHIRNLWLTSFTNSQNVMISPSYSLQSRISSELIFHIKVLLRKRRWGGKLDCCLVRASSTGKNMYKCVETWQDEL